jgi:hypothetical protein
MSLEIEGFRKELSGARFNPSVVSLPCFGLSKRSQAHCGASRQQPQQAKLRNAAKEQHCAFG